jgi:hypothetical protein
MREALLSLKNKDFIYRCLKILIDSQRQKDLEKLTDPDFCKRCFDMYYAILQEVSLYDELPQACFRDHCGNRRYYPQPIEAFGKRYIVCNDWYYNGKTTKRNNRTDFVNWVART